MGWSAGHARSVWKTKAHQDTVCCGAIEINQPLFQRSNSAPGAGRFAGDEIVSDGLGVRFDCGQVRAAFRRLPGFHFEFSQRKTSMATGPSTSRIRMAPWLNTMSLRIRSSREDP